MRDKREQQDSSGGQLDNNIVLARRLSQWQYFYHRSPFVRKGLFSGVAFLTFGLTGVLPIAPQTHPDTVVAKEIAGEISGRNNASAEERCYWQEDVRFFVNLQEKENAARKTDVPCEKTAMQQIVEAPAVKSLRADDALSRTIREMTAGYPVEEMVPAIARYDREIAGLIIGIAKKESNWGKRVPLDTNGKDCFNYWGYKGAGTRGVAMGHGCFGSQEEAVTTIGNRLEVLVALRKTSAPENMIIWKCGSSCKGHSDESVKKWIADVSLYYDRIAHH